MITTEVGADDLVVRFSGWDAVWALRRTLRVPRARVVAAEVVDRRLLRAGLRLGGTAWPGRIRAGRCWSPSLGWSFWFTRRAEQVLLVTLEGDHFRRVVLEVSEPAALAASLSPPS